MKTTVDFALVCHRDINQSNLWAVRWVTHDYLIGYIGNPESLLLPHNRCTICRNVLIEK